jgi:hypothetical protein
VVWLVVVFGGVGGGVWCLVVVFGAHFVLLLLLVVVVLLVLLLFVFAGTGTRSRTRRSE